MPNVGTYNLSNSTFAKVSTLLEITFDPTKLYEIQNQGDDLYIRAGENGNGEIFKLGEHRFYDADGEGGDNLFVAPVYPNSGKEKKINIIELDKKIQKNHEIF